MATSIFSNATGVLDFCVFARFGAGVGDKLSVLDLFALPRTTCCNSELKASESHRVAFELGFLIRGALSTRICGVSGIILRRIPPVAVNPFLRFFSLL